MAHLLANFPTLSKALTTQQKAPNGSKVIKKPAPTIGPVLPTPPSKKSVTSAQTTSKIGQALAAKFGSDMFSGEKQKKFARTRPAVKEEAVVATRETATSIDEDDSDDDDASIISDQDGFDDDLDLMAAAESREFDQDSEDDSGNETQHDADDMELDQLLSCIGQTSTSKKSADDQSNATTKKKKPAPKVVNSAKAVVIVNNENAGRRDPTIGGAREWRSFMTSDVTKMLTEPKPKPPQTKEEEEQDKQDDANDRELMDLLQTSKLIEDFNASELFGKDRRKYMENKLLELGAKKGPNQKMPFPDRLKMIKAEEKRMEARLKTAKETGMYHASMRTHIMAGGDKEKALKLAAKANKGNGSKRGEPKALDGGVGHFRNGTLHVGKAAVNAVSKLGKKKGRGAGQSVGMGIKITGSASGGAPGGKAGKKKKGGKKFKKR
ncbi:UNVERIFIED_CONTAM: hypothetical protein HDU68_009634 [Siphonaria sp. JEL0065]|nr:hypothetical protein HDU68_009634 [Siphonaria sp. JEL0065]